MSVPQLRVADAPESVLGTDRAIDSARFFLDYLDSIRRRPRIQFAGQRQKGPGEELRDYHPWYRNA